MIIRLVPALSGAWMALAGAASAQALQIDPHLVPCAACLELVLDSTDWPVVPRLLDEFRSVGLPAGVVGDLAAPAPPSAVLERANPLYLTISTPISSASAVFAARTMATAARAAQPEVRVAVDPAAFSGAGLPFEPIAAYVDGRWPRTPLQHRPSLADLVAASTRSRGEPLVVPVDEIDLTTVTGLVRLRRSLTPGLTLLNDVRVTCDAACSAESYLQPETLDAVAIVRSGTELRRLTISPGATLVSYVVDSGLGLDDVRPERTVDGAQLLLPEGTRWIALRIRGWRGPEETVFATGVEVSGTQTLSVEEIVARHQARRRHQNDLVRTTIAHGTTALLLEVPGFVAPVTITAATIVYTAPGVNDVEQRDIRVNGAAIAGGGASSPPQLPLVEPERVATPPLIITLTEGYRYALAGRAEVNGTPAYVVAFEPTNAARALARGRAWIDAKTFALLRVEATQTGLRGPIVSSEQHEQFGPFRVDGEDVWLPVRTNVFQMYEGAGYRTPIHRSVDTPIYEINSPEFSARLRAAYASPHVMLRETPQGFRYLLRHDERAGPSAVREVVHRAGERVRTAVFGVLVDPNITIPLPFAGLSYVDLNVMGTGAQLNGFFGGTYGQLSWSVPSLAGTRWQVRGRVFAIAARYNDRVFRGGLEQYRENITQRPAHVSAGAVRPMGRRARVTADYELKYTAFDRADTTDASFRVPVDAIVHGVDLALEAEAGAWTTRLWWNPARRQAWLAWGLEDGREGRPLRERDFQQYGVLVTRTMALRPTLASRVEAAWMSGRDLDRFSRYSFDAFENRLRGYPTGSIRYDRGGIVRSVTSWSARGWRVDGFADLALVRDPGFGTRARGYPGAGAALEAAGPLRTLWSVEWGYGFRARRTDGGLGTQAVRITGYRMF